MYEQYGKDYEYEAPVKLLDKLLHAMPQSPDEQLVVVSQVCSRCQSPFASVSFKYLIKSDCLFDTLKVLVADINIGYEDIVNIQVDNGYFHFFFSFFFFCFHCQ